jgi:nudix-type nucleoside diphosphatase (YffH/AdpP family)
MADYVKIRAETVLADAWGTLREFAIDLKRRDGTWQAQTREIYACGDGAAVLMHDAARDTVVLIRQFRLPVFLHGAPGYFLEVPAGKLDGDAPAVCARREAEEETGYRLTDLVPCGAVYMSPGAFMERVHLFIAAYSAADLLGEGGGLAQEGEDIEVVEVPRSRAMAMIGSGEIADAKTIILLLRLAETLGPAQ